MNHRLALLSLTLTLGMALACLDPPGLAAPITARPLVLRVGDVVRIKGTNVSCGIATRNGGPIVECLEIGRRIGSYGTLIGDKEILVVRFTTPAVARTVFKTRQHDANFATCR
jgi:hypothetical protein